MLFYFCFMFFSIFYIEPTFEISCKNENNRDVDWYVNYKLPKSETKLPESPLDEGEAYAVVSPSKSGRWKLSLKNITSKSSMLGYTLQSFYNNKKNLTYLLYNDEPPANYSGSSVGHLKGVLAFDSISGFWLIHSIPKFPKENAYEYPSNALLNGQSILCVTFATQQLNEISHQLLYDHPNIYAKNLTRDVQQFLDNDASSIFTDKPNFIRKAPFIRETTLRSLNNKPFRSFAKDNQFEDDLYSGFIAPKLQTSLKVESWRRGSGNFTPPYCRIDYDILDVASINMSLLNGRNGVGISFKSTSDHSKWAVSYDSRQNWICIGDINRMDSQQRRGGGALCFQSAPVWKAYSAIINETNHCDISP